MEPEIGATDSKGGLRRRLRATRRSLAPSARREAAAAVAHVASASPLITGARSLVGYIASDGELDVGLLLETRRRAGTEILLPRLRTDGGLDLVAVGGATQLAPTGPGGLLQPSGTATPLARVRTPAVVLAPAVALDRRGNRLGRGGGAYDRLLPDLPRPSWHAVGVCHAHALVERVPVEPHDRPVDAVLTDCEVFVSNRPAASGTGG